MATCPAALPTGDIDQHLFRPTRYTARVVARVLYAGRELRAREDIIARNRRGQSGLWAYGISRDVPIVVLRV